MQMLFFPIKRNLEFGVDQIHVSGTGCPIFRTLSVLCFNILETAQQAKYGNYYSKILQRILTFFNQTKKQGANILYKRV